MIETEQERVEFELKLTEDQRYFVMSQCVGVCEDVNETEKEFELKSKKVEPKEGEHWLLQTIKRPSEVFSRTIDWRFTAEGLGQYYNFTSRLYTQEEYDNSNKELERATKSLKQFGFTDHGAEYWQPPIKTVDDSDYDKGMRKCVQKISTLVGRSFGADVGYEDLPSVVEQALNRDDDSEWKNGEGVFSATTHKFMGYAVGMSQAGYLVVDVGDNKFVACGLKVVAKEESPEDKAARERLESARELYEIYMVAWGDQPCVAFDALDSKNTEAFLMLVDKTGYRK